LIWKHTEVNSTNYLKKESMKNSVLEQHSQVYQEKRNQKQNTTELMMMGSQGEQIEYNTLDSIVKFINSLFKHFLHISHSYFSIILIIQYSNYNYTSWGFGVLG